MAKIPAPTDTLDVLLYGGTSNPDNLPADWPAAVIEVDGTKPAPLPYLRMTRASYALYLSSRKAAYDASVAEKNLTAEKELRIDALWRQMREIIDAAWDEPAQKRGIIWLLHPDTPDKARQMVAAVLQWCDDRWEDYNEAKAAVLAGDLDAKYPQFPACPHTFRDIKAET